MVMTKLHTKFGGPNPKHSLGIDRKPFLMQATVTLTFDIVT